MQNEIARNEGRCPGFKRQSTGIVDLMMMGTGDIHCKSKIKIYIFANIIGQMMQN